MATIKSYTDLEQSKKLAEILPTESADMVYIKHSTSSSPNWRFDDDIPPMILGKTSIKDMTVEVLPCWSLVALLSALPNGIVMNKDSQNGRYHFSSTYIGTSVTADNPVDACYEMILKFNELNLL